MWGANSGYVGWSMSVNAAQAYEDGEMPKSKWTKKAMLAEIARMFGDMNYEPTEEVINYFENLKKDDIFDKFFCWSSWNHTSKFFNETDFYSCDEEKLIKWLCDYENKVNTGIETQFVIYEQIDENSPVALTDYRGDKMTFKTFVEAKIVFTPKSPKAHCLAIYDKDHVFHDVSLYIAQESRYNNEPFYDKVCERKSYSFFSELADMRHTNKDLSERLIYLENRVAELTQQLQNELLAIGVDEAPDISVIASMAAGGVVQDGDVAEHHQSQHL